MEERIENRTVIELKEKRKVMMHKLLDEILDSDDAAAIHAVLLNLKAYICCVKTRQERIRLETRLWRLENEIKLLEQSEHPEQ